MKKTISLILTLTFLTLFSSETFGFSSDKETMFKFKGKIRHISKNFSKQTGIKTGDDCFLYVYKINGDVETHLLVKDFKYIDSGVKEVISTNGPLYFTEYQGSTILVIRERALSAKLIYEDNDSMTCRNY